ncbi:hypothetical protein ACHAWT_004414 [Skeletonema menzelii]|mmetsp:Transcript_12294/g.20168  ORF Transcript_12294/g.20168 Transcript_12294/m.20168 type:complete len:665 (+) Transcript_12294:115-2109(+)
MRLPAQRSIFYCVLYCSSKAAPLCSAVSLSQKLENSFVVRQLSAFAINHYHNCHKRQYCSRKTPILYTSAKGTESNPDAVSNLAIAAVSKKKRQNKTKSKGSETDSPEVVRKITANKKTKKKTKTKRKMSAKKKEEIPAVPHAPDRLITADFDQTRSKLLTKSSSLPREKKSVNNPCIFYWMQRDMRTCDNWALLFAQSLAAQNEVPLRVVFALPPPPCETAVEGQDGSPPPPADMPLTERHGVFLLEGLQVVARELSSSQVPFDVICPTSRDAVGETIHNHCTSSSHNALAVVCDMSPLRFPRKYTEDQAAPLFDQSEVPLYQVDAHNIVPVWMASPKREVGARTLRPKINKVFADYCTQFPPFTGNDHMDNDAAASQNEYDWDELKAYLNLDDSIAHISSMKAGHEPAMERFRAFCSSTHHGLKNFDSLRNDPNFPSVCSNLSPWINYGQVSFQRLALDVRAMKKHSNGTAAYIEEGVVRRELSDNYVYYTRDNYDSLGGAADWARESLELHSTDEREYLYTWKELEKGETHDDLWNAAQLQLVREGTMHGFLRMYWAKKVLEWTTTPSYALATAQYLNDRYAYDGNDPNGFVGVGWSIFGLHDMGWKERPIFGKIRFMNYAGCKRKFKVAEFVSKYDGAAKNAAQATKAGNERLSGNKRKA